MNIGQMWDEKFGREGYLYGTEPNRFLKSVIDALPSGSRVLFLGEGEGRNACYAAAAGMVVSAIDASETGLQKLASLAASKHVSVTAIHLDLAFWEPEEHYDAILCAYLHLEEPLRSDVFVRALSAVAPGGIFAGEFFATSQIERNSGGPKALELLYDTQAFEKLQRPWFDANIEALRVELDEGRGHQGTADVIQVHFRLRSDTVFKTTLPRLTLHALFSQATHLHATQTAFRYGHRAMRYDEVADAVEALQARLAAEGVKTGDKVALCSENMPNWAIVYFAVTAMGAVIVPILTDFHDSEIRHIIAHAECKGVFVSRKKRGVLEAEHLKALAFVCLTDDLSDDDDFEAMDGTRSSEALTGLTRLKSGVMNMSGFKNDASPSEPREDDLAAIIYTSGTTGSSKGVMLTHRALAFQSLSSQAIIEVTPRDRFLSILPLAHTFECSIGLLVPFVHGASVTYLSKIPTPKILIEAMAEVKPTVMLSVPLVIEKIFKNRILPSFHKNTLMRLAYSIGFVKKALHRIAGKKLYALFGGELRFFGIGGAPLSGMVEQFLMDAAFPYAVGYGLTETAPLLSAARPNCAKLHGVGPAFPGVKLRIDSNTAAQSGSICVKGPNVMLGYFKNPEKTAEVFDAQGWFNTGDLGFLDADGYLFINGRSKNMLLGPSGENIYPEQIEAILMEHDAVEDALVYAVDAQLVARIHFDYDKLDTMPGIKHDSETQVHRAIDALMETLRYDTNTRLSKFSRLARIIEQREPFDKTPTKKIKRYLYTTEHT